MKKTCVSAGLALATSLAFGAVSENFNDKTALPTGWSGDGTVAEDMLAVDGTVTCLNSGDADAAATAKSTFLIKIPYDAVSSDDLASVEGLSGCQTAVAAGAEADGDTTKLQLMVYCGATPTWTATGITVAKGAWVNVELNMDYTAKMVQVKVGAVYATTGKVTTKTDAATGGAWYPLAKSISGTTAKVGSLLFVGSSKVDDVTIAEINVVPQDALPDAAKGLTVNPVIVNKYGDITTAKAPLATNMTILDKIECGLDPEDATTFTATKIESPAAGELAITIPYANDNGQQYVAVVSDGTTTKTAEVELSDAGAGFKKATFTIPTGLGKVLKFNIKAAAPAAK